jgi:hypothetical protein
MRHRHVAALVSVLLLLAACTDVVAGAASPGGSASRSSTPPSGGSTASPSPTPGGPAPTDEQLPDDSSFPADTEADGGPAEPGADDDTPHAIRVEGFRYSTQNGYVRLVVDLSGSGVPAWTLGYSEATGPGGGPVDIAGDVFLRLQLQTQAAPEGSSTTTISTSPGPIAQVRTTGFFEGAEEVLIGIRGSELPFRAFALTDPGRIVIDVPSAG